MISREKAFERQDTFETLQAIVKEYPKALRSIAKDDPWIGSLLEGMLQKNAKDRIPNGMALQELLHTKSFWEKKTTTADTFIFEAIDDSGESPNTPSREADAVAPENTQNGEKQPRVFESGHSNKGLDDKRNPAITNQVVTADNISWVIIGLSGVLVLVVVAFFIFYVFQPRTDQVENPFSTEQTIDTNSK